MIDFLMGFGFAGMAGIGWFITGYLLERRSRKQRMLK